MTERLELYKCTVCGNMVEVILPSIGELFCCGKPMQLLKANEQDDIAEKHLPVFVEKEDGIEVRIGTTLHPMTEEHYIQFIETIFDNKNHVELQYYKPQDMPILVLKEKLGLEKARAFCNLHGLWESEL